MLDFLMISTRSTKRESTEIYPKFIIKHSKDLMIRGGDFYAVWLEDQGMWSTDEQDALQAIDKELDQYFEENKEHFNGGVRVLHMWDAESGMIDNWHKYCQRQMRDSFHMLDENLIFSNTKVKKTDFASKRLPYPLEKGDISAYDRLMSVLYSPEERHKLEWAIGSIVTGDSKDIQKFIVLYGPPKSGKSTVINLIEKLFDGYISVFDAKSLGSANNQFALEAFRTNPLVAIQHDGDLSHIEDNTRLNSLVSHELMTVSEKFKSAYSNRFKCFLFMATNKPVKITDAKSGLLRRLIDVSPTGDRVSQTEYDTLKARMNFELGAIAQHCKEVYEDDPRAYEGYTPLMMLGASNDFYNFIMDSYSTFETENNTTLGAAWEMYKTYCEEANVSYPYSKRAFKEELKNYFKDYYDRYTLPDGGRVRSFYDHFYIEKYGDAPEPQRKTVFNWLDFKEQPSQLDILCASDSAQLATEDGTRPIRKWANNHVTLQEIDTSELHFLQPSDKQHIFADFDLKDEHGNKSLALNIEAASKWPPTYAELSKSGQGIHLHYIYSGDVSELLQIYSPGIEIKVCTGNNSIRRKLTKCNNLPIAPIHSGLPLKGEPVVNFTAIKNEKELRSRIKKCLNKEYENLPNTAPNIDFIKKLLDDAYASDISYDISDMRNVILEFAMHSSNQKEKCVKTVSKMKFKSEEASKDVPFPVPEMPPVFYDIEIFPNLFLINWKVYGQGNTVHRLINPSPDIVRDFFKYRLIGFNCRGYDNHMIYARGQLEYSIPQLFALSQKIISGAQGSKFGEAYNLSYTDVYEFTTKKQSLKKWEIELGIHHHELGLPWDQPVPEELWEMVSEYCDDDVLATEAVFDARQGDFKAHKILAALTGRTVNDNGNSMAEQFIFGNDQNPQRQFNWRDLSKPVRWSPELARRYRKGKKFRIFDDKGKPTFDDYIPGVPLPEGYSIMPFFPKYRYHNGHSYWGEPDDMENFLYDIQGGTPIPEAMTRWHIIEVGEGGAVYGDPGIYTNVDDEDVSSMHPHSAIADDFFGPEYTQRFEDLVEARVAIKHSDLELAGTYLDGALKPFLTEEDAKDLAQALKIVVNKIYGMSSAKYNNRFKDPANIDNFIAKRGALFMYSLKEEVEKRGHQVVHIKTDSIKIPDALPIIVDFVRAYGKEFGYTFEQEALFERFCLVNDAVYVAKTDEGEWTATGTQFQVPYVFKSLFTKEPIEFKDMCETKSVTTALYLGDPDDDTTEPKFVGKVGEFCPMQPGYGAKKLLRKSIDKNGEVKYSSVTGTKGYLWMESELVQNLGLQDKIDRSYYDRLVGEAIDTINKYGSYDAFVDDGPYVGPDMNLPF